MSKYAVEASFLGHRIPKEVKLLQKQLKTVKKDVFTQSIDSVVNYLTQRRSPDFSKELDALRPRVLFGGFYCIITRALRQKDLQQSAFVNDLKEVHLSDEVIEALVEVLFSKRDPLLKTDQLKPQPSPGSDYFRDLDWRLDVILSNNHLAKVLQPQVLADIKLENSEDITLHLSQEEFHALRQSTAKILHDWCQLREKKFMNSK